MAGILDTARYRAFLAEELNVSPKEIQAILMGGHGDTMVPLPRYTTVAGIPVTELIAKDKLDAIIERTKFGGGELVKLMGTLSDCRRGAGQSGKNGVEKVLELDLNTEEKALLETSRGHVKEVMEVLNKLGK